MSSTMSPPRFRRGLASVVATAATLAAVALTAAPAHAGVSVSPSTGLSSSAGGASVTVSGSAPVWAPTATHVTLAVCNVASGVTPGARCDAVHASGFETIADYGTGITFQVYKNFADYTFLGGGGPAPTGTSTTCLGTSGSQCAVTVSYYNGSGAGATQLGAELFNITFN
jgi:hypothetical protein